MSLHLSFGKVVSPEFLDIKLLFFALELLNVLGEITANLLIEPKLLSSHLRVYQYIVHDNYYSILMNIFYLPLTSVFKWNSSIEKGNHMSPIY
jgi:hypothetical protein